MFRELRSSITRADTDFRSWVGSSGRGSDIISITEDEIFEAQQTASSLRKQLQLIVDFEIASNNEACGVAINGMVLLRNERDEKKVHLTHSRQALSESKSELSRLENQCLAEETQRETDRTTIARMQNDTEAAQGTMLNLRAETAQCRYFQDNVDTETMHRMRADVQNLMIERERDEIQLRLLNAERYRLQSQLDDLRALNTAHETIAKDQRMKISEGQMTRDMYAAHREALTLHLQSLGGDPRSNVFGSMAQGFQQSMRGIFTNNTDSARIQHNNNNNLLGAADDDSMSKSIISKDVRQMALQRGLSKQEMRQLEKTKLARNKNSNIDKSNKSQSQYNSSGPNQVGGIVLGSVAKSGTHGQNGDSSDFLRKLPTIFKMGSDQGPGMNYTVPTHTQENVQEYMMKKEREVEFHSDSQSVSAISVITFDEEAWFMDDSDSEAGVAAS